MRTATIAGVLVVALALPAGAHSVDAYQAWLEKWDARVTHQGGPTSADIAARLDFELRHRKAWVPVSAGKPAGGPVTIRATAEQWRPLVARYFNPGDVDRALCLIGYESNGDPSAKNPTSSARGLFQILASLWAPHFGVTPSDLYNPETNTRIAAEIKAAQGWTAWAPYNRGLCR